MTLAWTEPSDNGGCPLLGFSLFRDNGSTGTPTIEVNSVHDPLIRNIPTLSSVVVQLDPADLGKKFAFILKAHNREGLVSSAPVSYLFSQIPDTPTAGPEVLSFSSSQLRARYLFAESSGGSPILSYNLQVMPSYTGYWLDVLGTDAQHSLATEHTIERL